MSRKVFVEYDRYEIVFPSGNVHYANFTRKATLNRDPNYGADTDGNRGEVRWCVEDDRTIDVIVDDVPLAQWPLSFIYKVGAVLDKFIDASTDDLFDPERAYAE